jgi:hypothetical protein
MSRFGSQLEHGVFFVPDICAACPVKAHHFEKALDAMSSRYRLHQ